MVTLVMKKSEDRQDSDRSSENCVGKTLSIRAEMNSGQYLESTNGNCRFYLQRKGNLVLRDWSTREVLWASGTKNIGGKRLRFLGDSNLVPLNDACIPDVT